MTYINQAPKEFAAQSAKFRKQYRDAGQLVRAGWAIQPKYDGVHCIINTRDGTAISRTGEPLPAAEHLVAECQEAFGLHAVAFMELYVFGAEHRAINGRARRQSVQPDLVGVVFDLIGVDEYEAGSSLHPYWRRLDAIALQVIGHGSLIAVEALDLPHRLDDAELTALALRYKNDPTNAYDGLILRDMGAPWAPGAAKNGEVVKVKPALSLDLRVVASCAERRATKLGGYLTVDHRGVRSEVGSGLTQGMLREIMEYEDRFVGQIAEVECLGLTPDGKLREPRFKGFRFDTKEEGLK